MKSFLYQFGLELRLYYRNRMALIYGYIFPTIFLVAFWVLYRHERVPLLAHMGELLTVTALGGACFGLPTAMVSERERGVWRRYRIAPVSTLQIVLGTLSARYVILLTAALLQLVLAMTIGMPLPEHLIGLWAAFTFVSFAFLGLGLVIAMLADNVPAVQALGQTIFLPMLIIGGVAVRIESLPTWAQHVSAFFPGRYSVQAVQATVDGAGLEAALFSVFALTLVGAAGCLAAAKMFRWDARERFVTRGGKAWLGVALAAWVAVGVLAEVTGRVEPRGRTLAEAGLFGEDAPATPLQGDPAPVPVDSGEAGGAGDKTADSPAQPDTQADGRTPQADQEPATHQAPADEAETEQPARPEQADESAGDAEDVAAAPDDRPTGDDSDPVQEEASDAEAESEPANRPRRVIDYPDTWQEVTLEDVERDVRFSALPYDEGLEAPIASLNDPVYPDIEKLMDCIRDAMREWPLTQIDDPVQRARNALYAAAVPDMYQMSGTEQWVPHAVFDFLRQTYPEDQLVKVLYWIATHPEEGSIQAADRLDQVCLNVGGPDDVAMLQERTGWYAAKLLGRITGHIKVD